LELFVFIFVQFIAFVRRGRPWPEYLGSSGGRKVPVNGTTTTDVIHNKKGHRKNASNGNSDVTKRINSKAIAALTAVRIITSGQVKRNNILAN
jgi:hypothetical protein